MKNQKLRSLNTDDLEKVALAFLEELKPILVKNLGRLPVVGTGTMWCGDDLPGFTLDNLLEVSVGERPPGEEDWELVRKTELGASVKTFFKICTHAKTPWELVTDILAILLSQQVRAPRT